MKKEKHYEVIGSIDENYINGARLTIEKKTYSVWMKWGAIVACLCLVVGLTIPIILNIVNPNEGTVGTPNPNEGAAGTLMGDTEIYPTVMVNGQLYEWRKGVAICDELPNDSMYYGEITHVDGESPTKDCEFVSVFSVSGQIYTVSENDCVYLCLTTDWLNETVVVFDRIEDI